MKTQLFKTVFFLTALFCIHCSDNETPQDQLPPITQTGANTFGAVINGEIFIPKDKTGYYAPGGGRPKGLNISSGDGIITKDYYAITAVNYIDIYIPEDRPQQKEYAFQISPGVSSSLETPDITHSFCYINDIKYISYENSGNINFQKVDFNQEICVGIFSLKLKNENNENDIIEITNGQFDLKCTRPVGD
jgi:hypothetical protein